MNIILWLLAGIIFTSFAEWGVHRYLMHRPSIRLFYSHFRDHAVLHHGRYYRRFDDEPDPRGRYLNLTLSVCGTSTVILCLVPIVAVSLTGFIVFSLLAVSHALLWSVIHSEMHLNRGTWFASSRVYRALMRYHFLHHKHPTKNYNVVVPLADYILGTVAKPTAADLAEWETL